MFEKMEYIVKRIDGDYAYLENVNEPDREEKWSIVPGAVVHFYVNLIKEKKYG